MQDPATAARFRGTFQAQHGAAYAREEAAARNLATAIREVSPNLPPRALATLAALETLAGSSEAQQVAELAGSLSASRAIPRGAAERVARIAADTQVREAMNTGRDVEAAVRGVATGLSTAGFSSTAARLLEPAAVAARIARMGFASAAGGALNVGADFSAFARTGDRTNLVAAGLTAGGVAASVAGAVGVGVSGLITVPLAGGALIARAVAQENEYRAAVQGPMQRALGNNPEATRVMVEQSRNTGALQRAGIPNETIAALAANPSARHLLTTDSMAYFEPYMRQATPAERAQLLTLSREDVGAAARAAVFGPGMLGAVSSPENRALLERLLKAQQRR